MGKPLGKASGRTACMKHVRGRMPFYTMAPLSPNLFCNLEGLTSLTEMPSLMDNAAAVPAASPVTKQLVMDRTDPNARWVLDRHLPATRRLSVPLGIKHR